MKRFITAFALLIAPVQLTAQTVEVNGVPIILTPPFDAKDVRVLGSPSRSTAFEIPQAFYRSAWLLDAVGHDGPFAVVENAAMRQNLYKAAVLSAVGAEGIYALLNGTDDDFSREAILNSAELLVDAAAFGTSASAAVQEVLSVSSGSGNKLLAAIGKNASGLAILSAGVGLAIDLPDQRLKAKLLAATVEDAVMMTALSDALRVLNVNGRSDRAMVLGLNDAISEIEALSRSRLRQFTRAGEETIGQNRGALFGVAALMSPAAGPAFVAQQMAELSFTVDDFQSEALLIAAQHNLAVKLQGFILSLVEDGQTPGGLTRGAVSVAAIAILQTRLTAEATARTHRMLFQERWDGGISVASLGRLLGLNIAAGLTAPEDLSTEFRSLALIRAQTHAEAVGAFFTRNGQKKATVFDELAPSENILFRQAFDKIPEGWRVKQSKVRSSTIEVTGGALEIRRAGAGGSGSWAGLVKTTDLTVEADTILSMTGQSLSRTVRKGCGDRCEEHPINVGLEITQADGSRASLQLGINYDDRVAETMRMAGNGTRVISIGISGPQDRAITASIRLGDYIMTPAKVTEVRLYGRGWDFHGKLFEASLTSP